MEYFLVIAIAVLVVGIWMSNRASPKPQAPHKARISRSPSTAIEEPQKAEFSKDVGIRSQVDSKTRQDDSDTWELNPQSIDVGQIKQDSRGDWVINPKSPLPLSFYGGRGRESAAELKQAIEKSSSGEWEERGQVALVLIQQGLECRQIRDYIEEYGPVFLKSRNEEDLYVRPYFNIVDLFDGKDVDLKLLDPLVRLYGIEPMQFYLKQLQGRVWRIPSTHRDRKKWEGLVQVGLANQGQDIELVEILEQLKLKEMNAALDGLQQGRVTRKTAAIESLLGASEAWMSLKKVVSLLDFFQVRTWDGDVPIDQVSLGFNFALTAGNLVNHTYSMGCSSLYIDLLHKGNSSARWEVWPVGDDNTCSYCKEKVEEVRAGKRIRPPFHIGCRCHIH